MSALFFCAYKDALNKKQIELNRTILRMIFLKFIPLYVKEFILFTVEKNGIG